MASPWAYVRSPHFSCLLPWSKFSYDIKCCQIAVFYIGITLALGMCLAFYQARQGHSLNLRNTLWLGYLLYISFVEELAFRLLFPMWLGERLDLTIAIVASNLIFAGIHTSRCGGTGGIVCSSLPAVWVSATCSQPMKIWPWSF